MPLYYKSKYSGETIEILLDKANSITANVTPVGGPDLINLKIGDIVYSMPQVIDVEANPNDAPTAELVKIKIGGRTFSIKASGDGVVDLNKILDPDNYPLVEDPSVGEYDITLEVGKLSRSDGREKDGEGGLRFPEFIPISGYKFIKPIFEPTSDGEELLCILAYDENYNYLNWYEYIERNKSFNLEGSDIPSTAVYLRGYVSTETDESGELSLILSDLEETVVKAQHKKIYFADHGYSVYGDDIDDETMHKLVIAADGTDGNTFNITEIKAPSNNPEEATLALMNWGNGRKQFVDISSMTYVPEKPTVEIVCQTRGGEPLPEFSVRYNDGEGAGRVRKFTVHPDAIPIELTSKGLKVRRNNDYNNDKNEEDYATINLFELAQKISEEADGLFIKKVELTDRASTFEMLNNVYKRALKVVVTAQGTEFICDNIKLSGSGSSIELSNTTYEQSQTGGLMTLSPYVVYVSIGDTENFTTISEGVLGEGNPVLSIPDEYWAALGVTVTIYYMD